MTALHNDQVANVGGFSVVLDQVEGNLNQGLFFHHKSGKWCTFAGINGAGLTLRYLDGTYAFGVGPNEVYNVGIQA